MPFEILDNYKLSLALNPKVDVVKNLHPTQNQHPKFLYNWYIVILTLFIILKLGSRVGFAPIANTLLNPNIYKIQIRDT